MHLINDGITEIRNVTTGDLVMVAFEFGVAVPESGDPSQVEIQCRVDDSSFQICMLL